MNWRRSAVALGVTVPVILLLKWGLTRDPTQLPNVIGGKEAPGFALEVMDAESDSVRLSDHKGEIVVLNFWASWCLACRDEHAVLRNAAATYTPRGVRFYGVLFKDTPRLARDWIAAMGGQNYPNLLECAPPGCSDGALTKTRVAIDYAVSLVPETVIIGRDGKIAHKQMGPVTDALMQTKLDSLLALPK